MLPARFLAMIMGNFIVELSLFLDRLYFEFALSHEASVFAIVVNRSTTSTNACKLLICGCRKMTFHASLTIGFFSASFVRFGAPNSIEMQFFNSISSTCRSSPMRKSLELSRKATSSACKAFTPTSTLS